MLLWIYILFRRVTFLFRELGTTVVPVTVKANYYRDKVTRVSIIEIAGLKSWKSLHSTFNYAIHGCKQVHEWNLWFISNTYFGVMELCNSARCFLLNKYSCHLARSRINRISYWQWLLLWKSVEEKPRQTLQVQAFVKLRKGKKQRNLSSMYRG